MINRFYAAIFTLILLLSFSCSKYKVNTETNIDIENLSIDNIETQLDIIHITADSAPFAYMMAYPHEDIEIDAVFNMYSQGDTIISHKNIELKIKGTSTVFYDLKSLKIKFIKKVNNQIISIIQVDSPLPGHHLEVLKKISLRNSGNDFHGTFIKDISYTELAIQLGLDLELSYYKPVQVFINHQYYGLLNLRTEKDDNSLGKLLDVDNDDINILKISHIGDGQEIIGFSSGDSLIIQNFIDAVKRNDTPYLLENIDLKCFADYIIFEDYIGNSDWPYNNVQIYNVGPQGKFRFFLYDLDFAADKDKLFVAESSYNGFLKLLYDALIQDAHFVELLQKRQAYIYEKATVELFDHILDINGHRIEKDIIYNIGKYQTPTNEIMWYYELQRLSEKFETRRKLFKWYYQLD
ncbi:CotH kinase family protein [Lentimicrobium sp. S6]|uniref:CotH kinase family protein n=1 Tax=Lentimicrobium sp. S6 TaxID=2735872 RepID=UPI001553709C|nr:CotH kinase family protein [Lentimicrobium sp. S6]NPD46303.1 hypothetical protein [Lentimicrobium sp. S6]